MTAPAANQFDDHDALDKLAARFPDEIRMMMATLRMSKLGGLSVAECQNPELQASLFQYFRRRLAEEQIYLYPFEVSPIELNLVKSLSELTDQARFKNLELTGKYKIVIFVYGLEKLSREHRTRFFQLLNFFRDRFTLIAQPVVIWAKPSFVTQMARSAPDFWNWKGALFSFPSDSFEVAATKEIHSGKMPPLQRYLQAVLQDPDYSIWADLYLPLKAVRTSDTLHLAPPRHTFTDDELAQLTAVFTKVHAIGPGKTIFSRGDTGDGCYVLLKGEVEVVIPDPLGNEIVTSRLKRGDFFGEIALIKNIPRPATVRTLTNCQYIIMTKPRLRAAAKKISTIIALMGDIAERRFENIVRVAPEGMSPLRRFASQRSLLQTAPADVLELVGRDERAVILGEAGTGKTTVLRFITLKLAQAAQKNLQNGKPVSLPIYIRLNALTGGQTIEDLILETVQGYGLVQFTDRADIESLLAGQKRDTFPADRFVFIMDGLNEIQGDPDSRQALNRFIEQFYANRFLLSCRVEDYIPIKSFRTALLQPLTRRDIETFLVNYMGQERGARVAREVYGDPQLIDLTQTPLALYMLTQITKKGTESLPKNRGVLFERFTENLLERTDSEWWKVFGRSRSKTPLSVRKGVLAELGLLMQKERALTCSKKRWHQLIANHIAKYRQAAPTPDQQGVKYSTPEDVHEEIKFSGLIRYSSNTEQKWIEFAHHTFQEFFAALALQAQNLPVADFISTPDGLRHWHGVIVLLYGISGAQTALFSEILGDSGSYARIWLAAQCLANSGQEVALVTETFDRELPPEQRFAMLFSVGLASHQLHRYREALTYLLRASELQPGNAEVQYELGALYRQLDQYQRAIQHLAAAIRLRPDFVDAYNQLGITYYDQQKHEEALTIFTATTQLEPANAHHYYNLGTVQKVLKDYEAARSTFQLAVQLKPDYTEARAQLDLLDQALASGVVQVLKSIPMLSKLTLEQSIMLAKRLKVTTHKAGEIIFHMGEMGDTFYIIESGEVQVLAPDIQRAEAPNTAIIINNLKAGDFFGEIALLRAVPRTATIRCATDVRLLGLNREDFNDIIEHHPSIAHNLAETSGYRLLHDRQTGRHLSPNKYYDLNYLQELVAQQNEVTVIMGDIHGSTFLTDAIGPELMIAFLDEYLLRMSTIVVNAGGAMDKSLGDSVMGVFGNYPDRPGETAASPALRALFAAFQMRQAYKALREEWKSKSSMFMRTGMGIGISTGPVSIGTVGAEGTMVGAVVNLSNKLSKMAIKGRDESELYIDQRTYDILGDAVNVELLDPGYVVGKAGGVELNAYRVIDSDALRHSSDNPFG
ncbi:MAG: cyclic nucleotide-binding domain-containing protein [Anaerolineae bacterium]